jgi:hypothetical protein
MSPAARTNLSPISAAEGRVCQLDTQDPRRVLVYVATGSAAHWDEMHWSQKALFEEAEKGMFSEKRRRGGGTGANRGIDGTLRISRKKIMGTIVEILQRDLFNEPERGLFAEKPNMESSLASARLGFFQSKAHKYVYILSKKDIRRISLSQKEIASYIALD